MAGKDRKRGGEFMKNAGIDTCGECRSRVRSKRIIGKFASKDLLITVLIGYAVYNLPFWSDMTGKVWGGLVAILLHWVFLMEQRSKK